MQVNSRCLWWLLGAFLVGSQGCGPGALEISPSDSWDPRAFDGGAHVERSDTGQSGTPDQGVADQGISDRGIPDQGLVDQGIPDRGLVAQGTWSRWSAWTKRGTCSLPSGGDYQQRFSRTRSCLPITRVCEGVATQTRDVACNKLRVMSYNIHAGMDPDPWAKHVRGETLDGVVQLIKENNVDIAMLQEVQQDGWYYHRYASPRVHADHIQYLRGKLASAGYRGIFAKFRDEVKYRADTQYQPGALMVAERDSSGAVIREGTHNLMTFMSSRVKAGLARKDQAAPEQSWWFSEVISTWDSPSSWLNVRAMLTMKFFLPGFEPLVVVNVHIVPHNVSNSVERMAEKRAELTNILRRQGVYAERRYPVLVGGDFNLLRRATDNQQKATSIEDAPYTWQNRPANQQAWVRALQEFGVSEYRRVIVDWAFKDPAYQCNAASPGTAVDFIFFKRMNCSNYQRLRPKGPTGYDLSDHRPVFVDLYLPPLPPS